MPETDYEFALVPVPVERVETQWRRIVTPQPTPGAVELLRKLRRFEPRSMTLELPVIWNSASEWSVEDPFGNRWLDFTSGIFVANAGHAHPRVRDAIEQMVSRPLLHNYSFATEIRMQLVEKLVALAPPQLDTVLLLTTGAEANEAAIKVMRVHGMRERADKLGIVSLTLGFHGKTMGAQTASGRQEQKRWIGPLDPNFHQISVPYSPICPWHDALQPCGASCFKNSMKALAETGVDLETIAGFLVEPYQGWSAAFLPEEFVREMRAWADQHGALLAFDEVQAGIGRAGKLFAHEHFGVPADLVACGKGISSSLPLSALLGPRELIEVDDSFHSTHGGNPVCCAAALANLEVIEEEQLVERGSRTGETLGEALRELAGGFGPVVPRVEGRGMVWALHLVEPESGELDAALGDIVIECAMRMGLLLIRTGTGTIKIGPPLSIPKEAALEGAGVVKDALGQALPKRSKMVGMKR